MDTPPVLNATLTYKNTKMDLFRAQLALLSRNKGLRFLFIFVFGYSCWYALRQPGAAAQPLAQTLLIAFITSCIAFAFGFTAQLIITAFTLRFKKLDGQVGEHTLEILDEGLRESTAFNVSLHRWASAKRPLRKNRYALIRPNDSAYFYIPISDANRNDVNEFLKSIESKIQSQKSL